MSTRVLAYLSLTLVIGVVNTAVAQDPVQTHVKLTDVTFLELSKTPPLYVITAKGTVGLHADHKFASFEVKFQHKDGTVSSSIIKSFTAPKSGESTTFHFESEVMKTGDWEVLATLGYYDKSGAFKATGDSKVVTVK